MTVKELAEKLKLKVIVDSDNDTEITGCYIGDLLSWVMGRAQEGNVWITVMGNINGIAVAVLSGVSCILLAEDAQMDNDAVARAKQQDVPVFCSSETAYTLSKQVSRLLGDE